MKNNRTSNSWNLDDAMGIYQHCYRNARKWGLRLGMRNKKGFYNAFI